MSRFVAGNWSYRVSEYLPGWKTSLFSLAGALEASAVTSEGGHRALKAVTGTNGLFSDTAGGRSR